MSSAPSSKWVWDLYPFAEDTWGAWEIDDVLKRPDHRVFMYRYQGEGYVGPVSGTPGQQRPNLHREGYLPTDDDLALLKRSYPKECPHRPQ